jgi:hypothetical protein
MVAEEQWRPVPGWPRYEVSDAGRVRTWKVQGPPYTKRAAEPRALAVHAVGSGYLSAPLSQPGSTRRRYVHRLVLEAFVGPCPPGMEACHNNGLKTDNRLENLRWDTHRNNVADAAGHGTVSRGRRHLEAIRSGAEPRTARTRLTEDDVRAIRAHRGFLTGQHLSALFGVRASHVSAIQSGKSWSWVSP